LPSRLGRTFFERAFAAARVAFSLRHFLLATQKKAARQRRKHLNNVEILVCISNKKAGLIQPAF
jgi:hypothetical protein